MGTNKWDRQLLSDYEISYPGGVVGFGTKCDALALHIDLLGIPPADVDLLLSAVGSAAAFPLLAPTPLQHWADRCRSTEVGATIYALADGIKNNLIVPSQVWRFSLLELQATFEIRLILDPLGIVSAATAAEKLKVTQGLADVSKFVGAATVIAKYLAQTPSTTYYPGAAAIVRKIFLL